MTKDLAIPASTEISTTAKVATILYSYGTPRGHVAVAKLSPLLRDYDGAEHQYVVSSAVDLGLSALVSLLDSAWGESASCETYLFPAHESAVLNHAESMGDLVADWSELPGSIKGYKDHEKALEEAGYDVIQYEAEIV